MGNRLSKIYTRTGDDGTTGLGDGSRVDKDCERTEAIGAVDELNSIIGLMLTYELPKTLNDSFTQVQHELFDLGGELSIPGYNIIKIDHVDNLEQLLDDLNKDLSPLKDFILPGGTQAAAVCHFARSVCRRAERRLITLSRYEEVSDAALMYLNRLSDLLFVVARYINKQQGTKDVLWQSSK
ncbi:cob(I)yrinic acid a,c-diamide adenosyltransferase [Kaarinaea lacus]